MVDPQQVIAVGVGRADDIAHDLAAMDRLAYLADAVRGTCRVVVVRVQAGSGREWPGVIGPGGVAEAPRGAPEVAGGSGARP